MSMSVSLKKSTTKTNIDHNNRTMSDKEKERNSHVDYERSDENKYLIQEDIRDLYEREFGEALENYNAKQRRADRKIKSYYKHIEASKKTSTQDRKSTRLNSSHVAISYAVFCLKKKNRK